MDRMGQFSRPYSPNITTAVSVRGGANSVNMTDSPAFMSMTVEFWTKPMSELSMR